MVNLLKKRDMKKMVWMLAFALGCALSVSAQQADISRKLKAGVSPEEAVQLMTRLTRLNEIKKTINIKLGRLKK